MTVSPKANHIRLPADGSLAGRTNRRRHRDPDKSQILHLFESYSKVLTAFLESTNATKHVIILSDNKLITVPQYPLILHYEDAVKTELTKPINMNILEFSDFANSLPILRVLKRDGSLRLCVDYREMNQVTLVHQDSIPSPENMFP